MSETTSDQRPERAPKPRQIRSKAVDVAGSHNIINFIEPKAGFPLMVPIANVGRASSKRFFNFTKLAVWGVEGNEYVVEFVRFANSVKAISKVGYYSAIRRFLEHCVVASGGRPPSTWVVSEWRFFTNTFLAEAKKDPRKSNTTYNDLRSTILAFLQHLWNKKKVPQFLIEDRLPENTRGKKLGIGSRVPRQADSLDLSVADKAFLDELAKNSDITDPAQLINRTTLLQKRVRSYFEGLVRLRWDRFLWADTLITTPSDFDVEGFVSRNLVTHSPPILQEGWVKEIPDVGAALKVADRIGPHFFHSRYVNADVQTLSRRFRIKETRDCIFPSPIVLAPFQTLLLSDLANEAESALAMKSDCSQLNEDATITTIRWVKGRGGAAIMKDAIRPAGSASSLELDSTSKIESHQLIVALNKMQERLVKHAVDECKTDLFLCFSLRDDPGKSSTLTNSMARYSFNVLRKRDPVLSLFPITLDSFRSTAGDLAFLQSGGNLEVVQRELQHESVATTQGYIRGQAGALLDARKARELQDLMLLTATRNRKSLHEKLNIEKDTVERLSKAAAEAGMFGWQLDADVQTSAEKMSDFANWMMGAEHVLVESVPVAAEIIAFEEHLRSEAKTLRNFPSWETTWVYVLIFLNAAITEMRPDIRRAA